MARECAMSLHAGELIGCGTAKRIAATIKWIGRTRFPDPIAQSLNPFSYARVQDSISCDQEG
jgi:hypothetical protein